MYEERIHLKPSTMLTGNTMKLFRQMLPGKEIASLKFCVSSHFYQNIKKTFKLIRKGHISVANLIKILAVLLMAPSEKRNCTTRTRLNDSMSFAI